MDKKVHEKDVIIVDDEVNKKALLITRLVMFIVGATVGALAMWQFSIYYPNLVKAPLNIVYITVCSVACAFLLALSSKPIYQVFLAIMSMVKRFFESRPLAENIAGTIGFVFGGVCGYLFEFALRVGLTVVAVRVLIEIIIGILLAFLFGYVAIYFVRAKKARDAARAENVLPTSKFVGYVITSGAFKSENLNKAATMFINVKVLPQTVNALIDGVKTEDGVEALKRFESVRQLFGNIECKKETDELAAVKAIAQSKNLRIIASAEEKIDNAINIEEL